MGKFNKGDAPKSEILSEPFDLTANKKIAIIKWGDNEPTLDIRRFTAEMMPLKGISLNADDIDLVREFLSEFNGLNDSEDIEPVQRKVAVDLMSSLTSSHSALKLRQEHGYATSNGKIALHWKKGMHPDE